MRGRRRGLGRGRGRSRSASVVARRHGGCTQLLTRSDSELQFKFGPVWKSWRTVKMHARGHEKTCVCGGASSRARNARWIISCNEIHCAEEREREREREKVACKLRCDQRVSVRTPELCFATWMVSVGLLCTRLIYGSRTLSGSVLVCVSKLSLIAGGGHVLATGALMTM